MHSLIALMLLAAFPDAAATTATQETAATKPVKVKKICRSIIATANRLGKRECKTQAEWDSVDKSLGRGQSDVRSTG